MNKGQYKKYLMSPEWGEVRRAILARDGFRCRVCNSGLDLNVHHRSYEFLGREFEQMTDLLTLCHRCHERFHGKEQVVTVKTEPPPPKPKQVFTKKVYIDQPDFNIPDKFYLSEIWINRLRTPKGSFTRASMDAVGVSMKKSGWSKHHNHILVTKEQFMQAWRGRFIFTNEYKHIQRTGGTY